MNDPKSKLSRRNLVAGAGTVGALAAAAAVLPVAREAEPAAATTGAKPEPGDSAGYRLTAHVQRYYQTTKV
jgi:NCAIR mutase (PurE)-related protein